MSARATHDITLRLLSTLRSRVADFDQLDPADRELIAACCADAARLQLAALAAPPTPDAQLRLLREKAQIQAQLSSLAAAGSARLAAAFWDSVKDVVNGAVAVAFAAL
jgi:hypothetical protein